MFNYGKRMSFKIHLEVKVLRIGLAEDENYHWLEPHHLCK